MQKIKAFFIKAWDLLQKITIWIYTKIRYDWQNCLNVIVGAIVNAFIVFCCYKLGRIMLANETNSLLVGSILGYPLAKLCGKYAVVGILKLRARICK